MPPPGNPLNNSFGRDRHLEARTPTLKPGLFEGVVIGNQLPNNLVQVNLEGLNRPLTCVWAGGIVSSMLGFRQNYIPPINTRVLVYYREEAVSYIMGSVPSASVDAASPERALLDPDGPSYHDSHVYQDRRQGGTRMMSGHQPPIDLAEGEISIDNLMGVGITLLRSMALLSAGERARVETSLMNDMVRVISGNFRHHSAIGDHRIYNDGGRLNMEWHGAAYDFEAFGNPVNDQARVKIDGQDNVDLGDDSQIDGYADEMRSRLSLYVGWLGDFINLWVSDPTESLGRLASDALRAGKFRHHVGADGTCLVQSVAEIAIEKVVRIPVPVRIRREDDPAGNRSDGAIPRQDLLRQWQPSGNLFEMAFQLREYARWLSNTWTMARFHQLNLDFKVPTEAQSPAPSGHDYQEDKQSQNGNALAGRLVYACIRILRDGSIMTVDAYGNSILTGETGVLISSTRDVMIEAAGSINLVAGRDVNVVARRSVELSAITGAVRVKAEAALQFLSKAGRAIFDFVEAGWLVVRNGGVNANGQASLNGQNGNVDGIGSITGMRVAAAITNGPFGDHQHMFHIYSGSPAPETLAADDVFAYPTDHAAGTLYQSPAQQALERGEQASSSSWDFSGNQVAGKGSPWPGNSPVFRKTSGGSSLNEPAEALASNQPAPLAAAPISLKVQ